MSGHRFRVSQGGVGRVYVVPAFVVGRVVGIVGRGRAASVTVPL